MIMEIVVRHRDEVAAVGDVQEAVVVVESVIRVREELVMVDPDVRAFLDADGIVAYK